VSTIDYDPMVYDVLRETATQLRGLYLSRAHQATTTAERDQLAAAALTVRLEVDAVDVHNEYAVRAKTAELTDRLRLLRAA
jgi:hypothetical protein